MRNPFFSSPGPRFVDREELLALAREMADRIGTGHPQALRVLLFGSFARGDYSPRSDLDFLVILKESAESISERIANLLQYAPPYPVDVLPLTEAEVTARLEEGDPFLRQALKESILLWEGKAQDQPPS